MIIAYIGLTIMDFVVGDVVRFGFGDAVTPEPEEVVYPSMLSEVFPRIMAYPMVTMLAEKCAIMVELGFANSRMKDFFDVWTVLNEFDISEEVLKSAIAATFKRRGTKVEWSYPGCAIRISDPDTISMRISYNHDLLKKIDPNDDIHISLKNLQSILDWLSKESVPRGVWQATEKCSLEKRKIF